MLQACDVSRCYGTLRANDCVNLTLVPGSIVALLGENGAGKSTLVRLLSGAEIPDEGRLLLDGQTFHCSSPREAQAAGISAIHQEFALIESLTVFENLRLSLREKQAALRCRCRGLLARYDLPVPLEMSVRSLSVPERQRVELLRGLLAGGDYLLLDEPAALLDGRERERLLLLLRTLASAGRGILLVTHHLGDALEIADQLVVLRQGRVVLVVDREHADRNELARAMVGQLPPVTAQVASRPAAAAESLLVLDGVATPALDGEAGLQGVSLSVGVGEVLGVAGVPGSGQQALAEVIAGMLPPASGRILLDGREINGLGPRQRLRLGIAHVPGDRRKTATLATEPIYRNLCLRRADTSVLSPGGVVHRLRWRRFGAQLQAYQEQLWDLDQPVQDLSGGNLQQLILLREMDVATRLLVAAWPTRGLDIRACAQVRQRLLKHAQAGCAILLISQDIEELLALSHRIIFLSRGQLAGALDARLATAEAVGNLLGGGL